MPKRESTRSARKPSHVTPWHEDLEHIRHQLHRLIEQGETLMSTAADLTAATASLTSAVARVAAEIADLKNQPPPPVPLIDQPTLDAATTAVTDATTALNAL